MKDIISTDPLGVKQVYYRTNVTQLATTGDFVSLLKAASPARLNPEAIHSYMHYMWVPSPLSPVLGISRLLPGHRLFEQEGRYVSEAYWRLEDCLPLSGDPVRYIRKALIDSVEKLSTHSRHKVIGLPLSGGLDSSIIACLLKRQGIPFVAFSVGYVGRPLCDERAEARQLATYLNIPFVEIELHPDDVAHTFPEVVQAQVMPIADITGSGYYALCKRMKEEGIEVFFSGQGSDELLWGYNWLRSAVHENEILVSSLSHNTIPFLKKMSLLCPLEGYSFSSLTEFLKENPLTSFKAAQKRINAVRKGKLSYPIFYDSVPFFQESQRYMHKLYTEGFRKALGNDNVRFGNDVDWISVSPEILLTALVARTYGLENGIVQCGNIARYFNLDMLCPFFELKFVETVMGLRKTHSDSKLGRKYWLRQAMKDIVPDFVLQRKKKRGFTPPVLEWQSRLHSTYGSLLHDGYLVRNDILTPEAARFLGRNVYLTHLPFTSLVLEMWCRRFFEKCHN